MSQKNIMTTEEKTSIIMAALDDKKAMNPVVINVRGRTTITDNFIVASGTSNTHVRSLIDAVIDKFSEAGMKSKRIEGYDEATWILLDYGDVIVHVFAPEQREFYRIEAYWSGEEKGSPPPLSPSEI